MGRIARQVLSLMGQFATVRAMVTALPLLMKCLGDLRGRQMLRGIIGALYVVRAIDGTAMSRNNWNGRRYLPRAYISVGYGVGGAGGGGGGGEFAPSLARGAQ